MKIIMIIIMTTITANAINLDRYHKGSAKYSHIINETAKQFNLDTLLIHAIIEVESGWNEMAQGDNDCNGLMQVKGGSFNPKKNILQGCSILRRCLDAFNGNIIMALTAYNSGIAGAKRKLKDNQPLLYARKVLNVYWILLGER